MEQTISIRDVRAAGWCLKGAREFCARHGIDWGQFRTEGVAPEVMLATGDARAIHLVEQSNERR
jgi:hypothetical protein